MDAGRPFEQLQEAGMRTARLDEILRQKDPALKETVEQLARGEVREAIGALDRQGRVHEISEPQERMREIAREYAERPEGTLVISPDNKSRTALNETIHRELQQRGAVSREEYQTKVLIPRQDMTGVDRAWAAQYDAGDVVRYTKGSRAMNIDAGEYATVRGFDCERNQLMVERENGERVSYDPRRLQGVTVYRESEHGFSSGDDATIKIGTSGTQTSFFAAGIRGVTTGNNDAIAVMIDSNGQLGTVSSSRRFKEDIHDMGNASLGLMRLRPVTFRYKKPFADGFKPIQYGLIVEEVAKVYPDLVARSADGQIETVRYQVLTPLLLNEVQRQQAQSDAQAARIQTLEQQVQEHRRELDAQHQQNQLLLGRLSKLEAAIASSEHSR